jgi:hypothetical protein
VELLTPEPGKRERMIENIFNASEMVPIKIWV